MFMLSFQSFMMSDTGLIDNHPPWFGSRVHPGVLLAHMGGVRPQDFAVGILGNGVHRYSTD